MKSVVYDALRLRFNPDVNAMHHGISNMQAIHIVRGWNRTQRRQFVSSAVAGCCRSCKDMFRKDLKLSMMQGIQNRLDLRYTVSTRAVLRCVQHAQHQHTSEPPRDAQVTTSLVLVTRVKAEKVDMDSMDLMEVYEPVQRSEVPAGANICKSRFVYDIKAPTTRLD